MNGTGLKMLLLLQAYGVALWLPVVIVARPASGF
jgi:hypothetical protein